MFAARYQAKYASKYPRRRRPGPRRWLAVFLLCTLVLFSTLDPSTTFSRYMVNLQDMFLLNTSHFYLTPSLSYPDGDPLPENNQLTYDKEAGFTEDIKLEVANNSADSVTTHDMQYSISLIESGPNPLFDLYLDDGLGGKTRCENNVINGTLAGSTALSESYTLSFGLKDGVTSPAPGNYPVNLVLSSSEPYTRTYTFKLNIQVEDSNMIQIPGTDIERPNVEIREGEIMVFKEEKFAFLTVEDLLNPLVVDLKVDEMNRPDLYGGSLYVPASAGDLLVQQGNQTIDWDVAGHVILEPDIIINNNNTVDILSRYGDVIFNDSTISGQPFPYQVNITAMEGSIQGHGSSIDSKYDKNGIVKLEAKSDIILSESDIASQGNNGIKILSEEGTIDVSNAVINSTNEATAASVVIQTAGHINLDGAQVISNASTALPNPALLIESTNDGISAKSAILTSTNSGKLLKIAAQGLIELDHTPVSSGGPISISTLGDISADSATLTAASNGGLLELLAEGFIKLDQATLSSGGNINIQTPGDISAKSANIFNNSDASYGHSINIYSINGAIDLSTLEVAGIPQTVVNSPPGNINIKAKQDIWCISSSITASSNYSGMVLRFESTGQGSKLYVDNATLSGHSIKAYGLQIEGTPASGNIQQL